MKRTLIAAFLLLAALPLLADQQPLFAIYETARQALLKNSVADVQSAAKDLASAARSAKNVQLATKAEALSHAASVNDARNAFASVSDEMIKVRDAATGEKPAVAYCSMEKKYWLQPRGAISNPYVDAGMRACGEIKR